jgi:hypothetical protein
MDDSFGTRLRSQRERQHVPLAVIAEQTKIKMSLLDGLERDDVSQWPAGIFRRSFVRAYAHAIGLEPDAVLREFLERHPEPAEEDIPAILAAARESQRPPTRLAYLISTAIHALPAVRVAGSKARPGRGFPANGASGDLADETVRQGSGGQTADDSAGLIDAARADVNENPGPIVAMSGESHSLTPAVAELAVVGRLDSEEPFEPGAADAHALPEAACSETLDPPAPACDLPCAPPVNRNVDGAARELDLAAIAGLCTRLARAIQPRDIAPVLEDAARMLNAVGVILWMWDPATRTLRHVLAYGYSAELVARLPRVRYDTDNAIAEAFRSNSTRIVKGSGQATGAVVVPMVTPAGCAGVLALELHDREEERESVHALATILAAQLATLFGYAPLAEAVSA